jgi:hypothetical protein
MDSRSRSSSPGSLLKSLKLAIVFALAAIATVTVSLIHLVSPSFNLELTPEAGIFGKNC